jgi:hypothetical protein
MRKKNFHCFNLKSFLNTHTHKRNNRDKKMQKPTGIVMLYFVYSAYQLLFEKRHLLCHQVFL